MGVRILQSIKSKVIFCPCVRRLTQTTNPPKIQNSMEERIPLCLLAKLDSTHRLNLTLENLFQVRDTLDRNP